MEALGILLDHGSTAFCRIKISLQVQDAQVGSKCGEGHVEGLGLWLLKGNIDGPDINSSILALKGDLQCVAWMILDEKRAMSDITIMYRKTAC